jgi:hypothetical protein
MTISIPPELETQLKTAASQQGLGVDKLAARLLEEGLAAAAPGQEITKLFATWEADDHTDDPAELVRRNEEFEQFKASMNQSRRESEGPNARKIYP